MAIDWTLVLGIASPIVTIIGLTLSNRQIKKQIIAETNKLKQQVALDKMADLPYKIQGFLKKESNMDVNSLVDLMDTIFAYGSAEAIRIAVELMQIAYQNQPEKKPIESLTLYVLLAAQIKYDVMGVLVKPSEWLKMKLTDYCDVEDKLVEANRTFVRKLGLNKDFVG